MRPVETDLRPRAEAAARAALERRWKPVRFELELGRETPPGWSHVFQCAHYSASFRVLERAGTAHVTLGERGTRVLLAAPEDWQRVEAPPAAVDKARRLAEPALRRLAPSGALGLRVIAARPSRILGPGHELLVSGFLESPEGLLRIDLDAETGELVGWSVPTFVRGSREGRPLRRSEAARRAEAAEALPAGASLVSGALEETPVARVWALRYEVSGEKAERTGQVIVRVHARTGVVVALARHLLPRDDLGQRLAREQAHEVVRGVLPALAGPDAVLVALVPGAVLRGGPRRAGWVGTATLGDGSVVRVSFAGDEVEVACGGESARVKVHVPA
ncbi:MAG TPA: hypothetical protein VFF73_39965 [Planctomycetota bacterium]|nr:hypothetical protein [Planctomycetota bacterium]